MNYSDPQWLLSVWAELELRCWCWQESGHGTWQTLSTDSEADDTVTATAVQHFSREVLVPELRACSNQLQV